MAIPQAVPEPVHSVDSAAGLAALGLTEAELSAALMSGEAAAAVCTSDHPPIAAGIYRFSEIVVALAQLKHEDDWTRRDYKNFSTIVRGDGQVAIAVASGDAGTGDLDKPVSTKFPKGVTTQEAVDLNMLLPFGDIEVAANMATAGSGPQTWFLLHHRRDGSLYAELSRPKEMANGHVVSWEPRYALTPQPLGPGAFTDIPESPHTAIVTVTPHG